MAEKSKLRSTSKWKDEFVVEAYILARKQMSNEQIARVLGVDPTVVLKWIRQFPMFKYALERGRGKDPMQDPEQFQEYVYNKLPPDVQALWDQINYWEDHDTGAMRVAAMLASQGVAVRQHLFIHAMVVSNFDASEACRRINVSKGMLNTWTEDPTFAKLMDELVWHKKNYFERALIGLVQIGNPLAVIFANRTLNKDRGYHEKLEVQVSGKVQHEHHVAVVLIDKLALPIEVRRQLLQAVRTALPPSTDAAPATALGSPIPVQALPSTSSADNVQENT